MSFLEISKLHKAFNGAMAVDAFSLGVAKGEFISLLGPSGCGKTTALRMVAGFEKPDQGHIRLDGTDITPMPASQRNIGMVFQSYALFPNMTVEGNIGFGLKVAGTAAKAIKARVTELLELVNMPELAKRYPSQLSGGQQQRVSLARALARQPQLLLLDEPLSALDAKIRVSLRDDLRALQRRLGITAIFVTHDQEEALALSDRVVVMSKGRIEQVGTPSAIYTKPATRFVATFVGALNVMECKLVDAAQGLVKFGQSDISLNRQLEPSVARISVGVRPEDMEIQKGRRKLAGAMDVHVRDVTFLGPVLRVTCDHQGQMLTLDLSGADRDKPPMAGTQIQIGFAAGKAQVLA